jgi:hypothetical protein
VAARFFVDESDLALGKALAQLYADVVFPAISTSPRSCEAWRMTSGSRPWALDGSS